MTKIYIIGIFNPRIKNLIILVFASKSVSLNAGDFLLKVDSLIKNPDPSLYRKLIKEKKEQKTDNQTRKTEYKKK